MKKLMEHLKQLKHWKCLYEAYKPYTVHMFCSFYHLSIVHVSDPRIIAAAEQQHYDIWAPYNEVLVMSCQQI